MKTRAVSTEEYWRLREPFDALLPTNMSREDVHRELEIIQQRFREHSSAFGAEGESWYFPDHCQHVRVFYLYISSPQIISPALAQAVASTMSGLEDSWIGELECSVMQPDDTEDMRVILYLRDEFIFKRDELSRKFARALMDEKPYS